MENKLFTSVCSWLGIQTDFCWLGIERERKRGKSYHPLQDTIQIPEGLALKFTPPSIAPSWGLCCYHVGLWDHLRALAIAVPEKNSGPRSSHSQHNILFVVLHKGERKKNWEQK
jgi:hypothetical protein